MSLRAANPAIGAEIKIGAKPVVKMRVAKAVKRLSCRTKK
jgi:nucleoid DNA-binding protein